jgi:hypothetical protein
MVMDGARYGQFDSFLPSVLCEETPTLSPQHAHIALCDKDLCVCLFVEFARPFEGAVYTVVRTLRAHRKTTASAVIGLTEVNVGLRLQAVGRLATDERLLRSGPA